MDASLKGVNRGFFVDGVRLFIFRISGDRGFVGVFQFGAVFIDRVGGGDAFSSGLIYALMQNDWKHEDIVNFAVASSVMKHAIRGDTNITSVDQIKRLMNNASFDVQR